MSAEGRLTALVPQPGELLFLAAAVGLLMFIDGPAKGLLLGLICFGGAIVVRRACAMRGHELVQRAVWLPAGGLALVAAPLLGADFRTHQLADAVGFAIVTLSLVLLTGFTGQISIGHSAFVGLGGYMTAICVSKWDVPISLSVLVGALAGGLLGLLIGLPGLRLSGPYLAIATVALAIIFPEALKLDALSGYTGGFGGLSVFDKSFGPPFSAHWLTLERWHYAVTLAVAALITLLVFNIARSPAGRAFNTVRDHEIASTAVGVDIRRTKLWAFFLSATIAGVAGGLLFIVDGRFVSPDNFGFLLSVDFLVAMVVGGMGSLLGAFLGALFLVYIYRAALETAAAQTQSGSNAWIFCAALVLGLLIAAREPSVRRTIGRVGRRLNEGGRLALSVGVAVAIAVALTGIARVCANAFLNLAYLTDAIAGGMLILVMLVMPGGLASLAIGASGATWRELGWQIVRLTPPAVLADATPRADEVTSPKDVITDESF